MLEAACPDCDIELGEAPGAFGGFVATVTKNDRAVRVLPVARKRMCYVLHKLRTTYLSRVAATELIEVTGSAAAWLGGATARATGSSSCGRCTAHANHDLGEFTGAAMREPARGCGRSATGGSR